MCRRQRNKRDKRPNMTVSLPDAEARMSCCLHMQPLTAIILACQALYLPQALCTCS